MQLFTLLTLLTFTFIQVAVASESKSISSRDVKRDKLRRHKELQTRQTSPYADHPDWFYLNHQEWYKHDATQQDHMRFHSYLAMSVYGDYMNTCPKTFLEGFTVLQNFEGGYIAQIPEMRKVVIVFRGTGGYQIDWTPTTRWLPSFLHLGIHHNTEKTIFPLFFKVEDLVANCAGCAVATGIKQQYLHIKSITHDFAVAKEAVARTGLLFSVTGHGTGGSIAALAAMDLGGRGLVHYSHNSGMPRTFNMAAVIKYDNLFQVLSGQSVVARNDFAVHIVPLGPLVHVGSKAHLTGDKTQWLKNCFGDNEDRRCLGDGTSQSDHKYYFTPLGQCGNANKGF